ncbi:MAG: RNA methyltransferase [Thermodesulfobacteriota bacterium]
MPETVNLDHIDIVLQRPRYPENIGAAVRAMRNMGLSRLTVVSPENFDLDKVLKMATHAAADTVGRIQLFDNLEQALASYEYVVGTTARIGRQRSEYDTPARMAERLIEISQSNRTAILFGPEDRGLTNEDLRFCHALVSIPTADFSSLNLSQAVMVVCYELFLARESDSRRFTPRLANRFELDNMYAHLKDILIRISFLNPSNPEYWLNNLRAFFSRMQLRAKDVKMIRGICRQVDWYADKRYQDGLADGRSRIPSVSEPPSK